MRRARYLGLLLAVLLVCTILAPAAAAAGQFTDVPDGAYYYDAVEWAVTRGITNGKTPTQFAPNDPCTRAQMVTFLWRMNGSPVVPNQTVPFTDVPASSYYYNAVLWATTQGITDGTDATHFSPNQTVTRAQAVTMIWRADGSKKPAGASGFSDVPAGAYYADAVAWAKEQGITNGKDAQHFAPNDPCTRAQIVTLLYRYACGSGSVLTTTNYPVILVHGLLGWGEYDDINGLIPYWGMTATNTVQYLRSQGVEAYAASVGPFSSAWDRACELYAQLTGTVTDYGAAHAAQHGHDRFGRDYSGGRYSPLLNRTWDASHPVNLVGHSFGGVTVRLLQELLNNGSAEEQAYMAFHPEAGKISPLFTGGKGDWVYSVTTLAAPANGMNLFESMPLFTDVGSQLIEEICKLAGLTPLTGIYDPQLEQFGIMPKPTDTIIQAIRGALTEEFLAHNDSTFQDLTIDKSLYLNKDIHMDSDVYYFSYYGNRMSYNAATDSYSPNGRMFPVAMPLGIFMGSYDGVTSGSFQTCYGPTLATVNVTPTKVGAEWHRNDGIVNSWSCRFPSHYENGVLVDDPHQFVSTQTVRSVRPGVWYVMPEQNMDHFSFMGGILTENQQTVRSFYDAVIENIVRCGG